MPFGTKRVLIQNFTGAEILEMQLHPASRLVTRPRSYFDPLIIVSKKLTEYTRKCRNPVITANFQRSIQRPDANQFSSNSRPYPLFPVHTRIVQPLDALFHARFAKCHQVTSKGAALLDPTVVQGNDRTILLYQTDAGVATHPFFASFRHQKGSIAIKLFTL